MNLYSQTRSTQGAIMKDFTRFAAERFHRRRGPSHQKGAAMVEFAIVSPFALLLVFGIIQLGLILAAKQIVNEAAFLGARAGSVQHAQKSEMMKVMTKALVPFYQDTTIKNNDVWRLADALGKAKSETDPLFCTPNCFLDVQVLNPSDAAFQDFGLVDSANHTYIPNDNLDFRHSAPGANSGYTIQDANALKIKVTYGYQLKVPLMRSVISSVMCGIGSGVDAFGNGNPTVNAPADDCSTYYNQGRIPIVAYATVQMQSDAWQ
ncbi:MAG TPA: TadE/TadG family type IV pilus assembly protein [Steroidobacteraceae bacterium]|nr:TadE/TadG family type IV pilus assembly protein [Steroidobacteraceae bacterium]